MGIETIRQGTDKNIVLETCPVCKGESATGKVNCSRCKNTGKIPSAKR